MMKVFGMRLPVVFIFVILALAVLITFNQLYHRFYVEKQMVSVLTGLSGVEQVDSYKEGQTTVYTVSLAKDVNVQALFYAINRKTGSRITQNTRIELVDKRDAATDSLWGKIQFPVFQALAQGDFSTMAEGVEALTAVHDSADIEILIDHQYLFIRVSIGEAYRYEILQRTGFQQEGPLVITRGGQA